MAGRSPEAGPEASGTIEVGGRRFAYRMRRSRRARRLRLLMAPPGDVVEVVLPLRARLEEGLAFLRSRAEWVARWSERLAAGARRAVPPPPLEPGAELPFQGRRLRLEVVPTAAARVRIGPHGPALRIELPASVGLDPVPLARTWLRAMAGREIELRVRAWSERMGVRPARVRPGDAGTRWGSCSAAGRLNFSWRLILAPPEVMDAVIIHELAHLREMSHSPRFYRILERYCPGHRQVHEWLRDNQRWLHEFGTPRSPG